MSGYINPTDPSRSSSVPIVDNANNNAVVHGAGNAPDQRMQTGRAGQVPNLPPSNVVRRSQAFSGQPPQLPPYFILDETTLNNEQLALISTPLSDPIANFFMGYHTYYNRGLSTLLSDRHYVETHFTYGSNLANALFPTEHNVEHADNLPMVSRVTVRQFNRNYMLRNTHRAVTNMVLHQFGLGVVGRAIVPLNPVTPAQQTWLENSQSAKEQRQLLRQIIQSLYLLCNEELAASLCRHLLSQYQSQGLTANYQELENHPVLDYQSPIQAAPARQPSRAQISTPRQRVIAQASQAITLSLDEAFLQNEDYLELSTLFQDISVAISRIEEIDQSSLALNSHRMPEDERRYQILVNGELRRVKIDELKALKREINTKIQHFSCDTELEQLMLCELLNKNEQLNTTIESLQNQNERIQDEQRVVAIRRRTGECRRQIKALEQNLAQLSARSQRLSADRSTLSNRLYQARADELARQRDQMLEEAYLLTDQLLGLANDAATAERIISVTPNSNLSSVARYKARIARLQNRVTLIIDPAELPLAQTAQHREYYTDLMDLVTRMEKRLFRYKENGLHAFNHLFHHSSDQRETNDRIQAEIDDRVQTELNKLTYISVDEQRHAETYQRVQAEVNQRVQAEVDEGNQIEINERIQARVALRRVLSDTLTEFEAQFAEFPRQSSEDIQLLNRIYQRAEPIYAEVQNLLLSPEIRFENRPLTENFDSRTYFRMLRRLHDSQGLLTRAQTLDQEARIALLRMVRRQNRTYHDIIEQRNAALADARAQLRQCDAYMRAWEPTTGRTQRWHQAMLEKINQLRDIIDRAYPQSTGDYEPVQRFEALIQRYQASAKALKERSTDLILESIPLAPDDSGMLARKRALKMEMKALSLEMLDTVKELKAQIRTAPTAEVPRLFSIFSQLREAMDNLGFYLRMSPE